MKDKSQYEKDSEYQVLERARQEMLVDIQKIKDKMFTEYKPIELRKLQSELNVLVSTKMLSTVDAIESRMAFLDQNESK